MPNATTLVIPNPVPSRSRELVRNLALDYPAAHKIRTNPFTHRSNAFLIVPEKDGGIQGFLQGIHVHGMLAKDVQPESTER
jgi:hypothetical protein